MHSIHPAYQIPQLRLGCLHRAQNTYKIMEHTDCFITVLSSPYNVLNYYIKSGKQNSVWVQNGCVCPQVSGWLELPSIMKEFACMSLALEKIRHKNLTYVFYGVPITFTPPRSRKISSWTMVSQDGLYRPIWPYKSGNCSVAGSVNLLTYSHLQFFVLPPLTYCSEWPCDQFWPMGISKSQLALSLPLPASCLEHRSDG